jgi:hypothetical protein
MRAHESDQADRNQNKYELNAVKSPRLMLPAIRSGRQQENRRRGKIGRLITGIIAANARNVRRPMSLASYSPPETWSIPSAA